jgi:hypothetical protein
MGSSMGGRRKVRRVGAWWRSARSGGLRQPQEQGPGDAIERLAALEQLLDGSALPNGVVELVVEDPQMPRRHLFDVHDGQIVALAPGSAVPWTSIAGSPSAWTSALGPSADVSQLRHTGDPRLAQRLLVELERRRLRLAETGTEYSVLDCS